MTIGGITLSRAAVYPVKSWRERPQNTFVGGSGTVRARETGPLSEFIQWTIKNLTKSEVDTLETYLTETAKFRKTAVAITDDWGTVYSARYWDKKFVKTETIGRLISVKLTFRIEN